MDVSILAKTEEQKSTATEVTTDIKELVSIVNWYVLDSIQSWLDK